MIEIQIPKDINKYEAKLVGPFTTRQTACFVVACAIGIPTFTGLTKLGWGQDLAIMVMLIFVMPCLLVGWVKPYGMNFEKFVQTAFISNILAPQKRKYATFNIYELLNKEDFCYKDMSQTMKFDKKEREKEMKRKINTNVDYMC